MIDAFKNIFREEGSTQTPKGYFVGIRIVGRHLEGEEFDGIITTLKKLKGIFIPETKLWYLQDKNLTTFMDGIESLAKEVNERVKKQKIVQDEILKQAKINIDNINEEGLDEIYQALREKVWEKQGGICQICGDIAKVCHHIQPRRFGGKNAEDNLIILCNSCHARLHSFYNKMIGNELLKQDKNWFKSMANKFDGGLDETRV